MANKDNQSKQYRIYIKESKSWVDVNKEFYTNYYRGGSTLIWFGLTWSLELYQQTNARLWRQGQAAGTVVIEHIITKGKYKSTTIVFLDTRKTRTATSSSIQNRQKS